VAGRAACLGRILEEDPSGDGPGVVLMSSFRVGALRPRRRPRSDPAEGVVDAEGAAAPFGCRRPSLQDQVVL
jgi:hypothetical protein